MRSTRFWTTRISADPAWIRDRTSSAPSSALSSALSSNHPGIAGAAGDDDLHPSDRAANSRALSNNRGVILRGRASNALPREMWGPSHAIAMLAAVRATSRRGRAVSSSNSGGGSHPLKAVAGGAILHLISAPRPRCSSAPSSARRRGGAGRDKGNASDKGRDNARANRAVAAAPIRKPLMALERRGRSHSVVNLRVSALASSLASETTAKVLQTAMRSSGHGDRCDDHGGTNKRQTGLSRPGNRISGPGGRGAGAVMSAETSSGWLSPPGTVRG